jgi:hypothetical protein
MVLGIVPVKAFLDKAMDLQTQCSCEGWMMEKAVSELECCAVVRGGCECVKITVKSNHEHSPTRGALTHGTQEKVTTRHLMNRAMIRRRRRVRLQHTGDGGATIAPCLCAVLTSLARCRR